MPSPSPGPDVADALSSLDAEQLRSFLRTYLTAQAGPAGRPLHDALLAYAAKHGTGFRPGTPGTRAAREAERFAEAARRTASADPAHVDAHLRAATQAFLARDYASARQAFHALLAPLAEAEVDLGQDELVDEVLEVDVPDCIARYLVSVFMTAAPEERPAALLAAMDEVQGLSSLSEPLAELERVALEPLPGLRGFLPRWAEQLERHRGPRGVWDGTRDMQVREAARRAAGTLGLAHLARTSRAPEDLRAWCAAVAEGEGVEAALRANDEAAGLVREPYERARFLDESARLAQALGRKDVVRRLEAAWRTSPSLSRTLRWLMAGRPTPATVRRRAGAALATCPASAGRPRALLDILTGEVRRPASQLARAPGLGWSEQGHPGPLLFPVFSWLLGSAPEGSLREEVARPLRQPPGMELDLDAALDVDTLLRAVEGEERRAKPGTPSVVQVLLAAQAQRALSPSSRDTLLDALRAAAEARAAGVAGARRRRHYEEAALLVGCCVELHRALGRAEEGDAWAARLRQSFLRLPAFQEALRGSLGRVRG